MVWEHLGDEDPQLPGPISIEGKKFATHGTLGEVTALLEVSPGRNFWVGEPGVPQIHPRPI